MREEGYGALRLVDAHFSFDTGGDFEESLIDGERDVAYRVGGGCGGVLVDEGVEGGG